MKIKSIISTAALLTATVIATPALADDIEFSGKIFFDYSSIDTTKNNVSTRTQGGNITRTYLTAKKKIDDTWAVKLTIDSALNKKSTGKKNEVFLKIAQLTGNFIPEANLKLGLIGTPWVGYEDKLGKHRYISKSFVDKQGFDHSADAGIGVFGKVFDGIASYDIVIVNGTGYSNTTRTNAQDINARIGFAPLEGLTIDFGYRNGYKGTKTSTVPGTKDTLGQVMVTYGNSGFRVGANYIQHQSTPNASATIKDRGLDLWAWANVTDSLSAFVNYESLEFDSDAINSVTEKRTVVSLDYNATKMVNLSLAYTNVTDLKGVLGDTEKTIGLYTQFKF